MRRHDLLALSLLALMGCDVGEPSGSGIPDIGRTAYSIVIDVSLGEQSIRVRAAEWNTPATFVEFCVYALASDGAALDVQCTTDGAKTSRGLKGLPPRTTSFGFVIDTDKGQYTARLANAASPGGFMASIGVEPMRIVAVPGLGAWDLFGDSADEPDPNGDDPRGDDTPRWKNGAAAREWEP